MIQQVGPVLPLAEPQVGMIVLYTNLGDRDGKYPPEMQAAIVTGVGKEGHVALHIFYKTGQFDMADVEYSGAVAGTEAARGKWSWTIEQLAAQQAAKAGYFPNKGDVPPRATLLARMARLLAESDDCFTRVEQTVGWETDHKLLQHHLEVKSLLKDADVAALLALSSKGAL